MDPQKPSPSPTDSEQPTNSPSPISAPSWSTATSATPSMPASSMGAPASRKKGTIVALIIGLIVIVLGGGAAAAYFGVIVPNKPENVLKMALANSFSAYKVKSEHFTGDMSVTDKESNQTYSGDFTGSANIDGAFEIKANVDAVVTKVTVDMRSVDGKSIYLKVGGLEGLPELMAASGEESAAAYAPMVAGLNEQWIEINESILRQMGASTTTLKMTDSDRQKMAQVYTDHQFIVFKEKLKDEKIANKDSYHYKVTVDKQQLKDFMNAVKDAKLDSVKLTQADIMSMNDALKDIDFSKYPVDVWIAKGEKLINQIKFTYSDKDASASIRYTITDYNKPVTVTKPADAKSLLEVISQMFGGSTNESLLMQELEGSGISL